jgi:hypothetical protein
MELIAVMADLRQRDPTGERMAQVLRNTLDQLYDGQRTGRYRWDQLFKTEKTHCGTLVEINMQREFAFKDGLLLDFRISQHEVDCKYSQTRGGWMIPPEAGGQLCLLMWSEDTSTPKWSAGLVRTLPEYLNTGSNRDAKATLNVSGRQAIVWLFDNRPLPPNVLIQLDKEVVEAIFAHSSGQKRINQLFRAALGRRVGRATVATVAQQDDYMKRVRANGGARTNLQPEGIIILGQFNSHAAIARLLNVPVPGPGESVSVRLTPAMAPGSGVAEIGGRLWTVAGEQSPIESAPVLPDI